MIQKETVDISLNEEHKIIGGDFRLSIKLDTPIQYDKDEDILLLALNRIIEEKYPDLELRKKNPFSNILPNCNITNIKFEDYPKGEGTLTLIADEHDITLKLYDIEERLITNGIDSPCKRTITADCKAILWDMLNCLCAMEFKGNRNTELD